MSDISKATPRPWEWTKEEGYWFLSPGVLICDGTDGSPEGDEIDRANAALIVEAVNNYDTLRAENARLREALTPSAETKAAYMGEFKFGVPMSYEDEEQGGMVEYMEFVTVPWTTIKEIMAAIRARAALESK